MLTLEKKLKQLQQQDADNLYIKIIIPENSGLSYNEAWNLTSRLLKYDYYHQ